MDSLAGIVMPGSGGRLFARHELYVRHLVDNVSPLESVVDVIVELLRTFTKFKEPIVRNVGRQDSLLFKFLLNHNFNVDLAKRRGDIPGGLRIYQTFEVEFQLDGHFWLQYGQYLVSMGRLEAALGVLNKSIQAYPNNPYAAHAYADLQLRVACERPRFDAVTVELIGDAVKSLEEQHARGNWESDQYPIVTLSERHIAALIKHQQAEQARVLATKYFRQLEEIARRNPADAIQQARERLAHFLTSGDWFSGNAIRRGGNQARRRR
jgi:tetratricopeptide (TPR) repeat protein